MWSLSGPQDLHRIEDRLSTVYVERSHIDRDDNAVVLVNKQRTVRIPAALVATVLSDPEPGSRTARSACSLTPGLRCRGRHPHLHRGVVPAHAGVIRP
jgi:CRISPR-associated protein Cas1